MKNEERLKKAEIAFEKYKQQKKEIIDKNLKLKGVTKAKLYFPITKVILKGMALVNKSHICYLNEKNVKTPKERSIIYTNTHKFKPDIETISLALNKPSVMVASDFKNSYKTINGWYFNTRPTIFVDQYSKEDKKNTSKMIVRYLQEGNNVMIFPEAVWNLSQNKIILDIFTGTVRAALLSNSVIVPSAIERYGDNYIINRKGFFDPIEILKKYTDKSFDEINNNPEYSDLRKKIIDECNIKLRDTLATLTYEIWESYALKNGLTKRSSISDTYWEEFIKSLMAEWPGYKLSDNIEQQVQNKKDIELEEIKKEIRN